MPLLLEACFSVYVWPYLLTQAHGGSVSVTSHTRGSPWHPLRSGPLLLAQGSMWWCPHTWLMPLSAMALPLLLNATSANSDTQNQRPIWCHQRPHSRIPSDIWTYTHQTQTFNPNPHRALVSRNHPLLCSEILTSRPSFPSDTGSDLYQSDI